MRRLGLFCLIALVFIGCVWGSETHAQQGGIIIHEASGGIGTVRWLGDGSMLSFENMGDIDSGTPSWRLYDLRSGTITISEQWPLQPILNAQQMDTFETGELTTFNLCPTGRFIVYAGRRDIRLNGYLSIADLSTGMHTVTDIPTYSPALPGYGLVIVWNIQCTAFTATITGPYGASRIYYITNFANDLTALRYVVSDYVTFGGQEYGILQAWDMTPDGNVILFRGGREGSDGVILYDVLNPDQSQIFFLGNMYTSWAAFDPQDPRYVLVFYESKFVRYDRVSGSVTLLAENAFNDIRAWGNILDLRVSPDGTHVAVTTIEVRNSMRMDIWRLYVVDISEIQLYSTLVPTPRASSHQPLTPAELEPAYVLSGHTGWVTTLAWSPDRKVLASSSGDYTADDFTVRLWDRDGNALAVVDNQARTYSLDWSPDGMVLASGTEDGRIALLKADGTLLKTFKGESCQDRN